MIRLSRTAPLLIATVASALLVAGPAYAQEKPAPGTDACKVEVAKDETVKAAPEGSEARAAAEAAATTEICTGTETPAGDEAGATPPAGGVDPDPADPGANQRRIPGGGNGGNGGGNGNGSASIPGNLPSSGNREAAGSAAKRTGGDKNCPNFATPQEAQSYFLSIGGSPSNNADRLDANHNGIACEDYFDDGDNQNASVTTTGDDESKADTSGEQVTEVPEGSAQTGGNS